MKILAGKKFQNINFNSIIFGSISIYKKKKRIKSIDSIQIRFKAENSKIYDKITVNTNEYFLIQAVAGDLIVKDIFFRKKYYKINKKFHPGKGDLVYLGNIKLTLKKDSLSEYSYKTLIYTNFKALKFSYNRKLTNLINGGSPEGFLKRTEGKILIPIYMPSATGEYNDRFTPFNAAANGDLDSLKKFLNNKEILNRTDSDGCTLLVTALRNKRKDIATYLIKEGIDINKKTNMKWSALMYAFKYDSLNIAKELIENGADLNSELDDGWNALFLALRYGCDKEFLNIFINKGVNINSAKKDKWTPLMMAIVYQDKNIADILLKNGASINVKDNENWTPLMYALRYGKVELAKKMIEKGADINAKNMGGWTPLLFAIRYNSKECADLLFENGADFTISNKNGFNPLHMALEYGFDEISKKIIKSGKTISDKTRYGWTPLMYALRNKRTVAASMMLKKRVSLEGVSKDGWNVLHFALRYDQSDNAMEILKRGQIDINVVTLDGWSPLLMAIRYNQPKVAKILIKKKADLNLVNKFGWTPLMMAIEYDQPEIAEILIKKRVKTKLRNIDGKTALSLAKEKNYFNLYTLMGGKNFSGKESYSSNTVAGLKGIWKEIIPPEHISRVIKCDNCTAGSGLCSVKIEYSISKSEVFRFLIAKFKAKGYKYDKGTSANSETSSLGNKNLWGLFNFTNNSANNVVSLTALILSDYNTGTRKTVVDFSRMNNPRKMN